MKTIKILVAILFIALAIAGCRKDNIDNGIFAVEPKDFLSDHKYEKLVVEICYVDGYKPEDASLSQLLQLLQQRLNKPEGILFSYKSIPAQGRSWYDYDALQEVEHDYRSEFTRQGKIAAWVFIADAPYSESNTLGLAYSNTSFAIFEKTILDNSGAIGQPSQAVLETTVMEHEFGHLMGLVDAGTPMATAHALNGHHCDNQDCLMYYAVETLDIIGNLSGGEVPELDAHCIQDLKANGGK